MSNKLTLGIISDIHCKYGGGKTVTELNTYLTSDILAKPVNKNPIESLKKLIQDKNITADMLLCPGDITDKMDLAGLTRGWDFLQQIKASLRSSELIATVGNHDVDSRGTLGGQQHAFESLKNLGDNYPTAYANLNDVFWSRNYCILHKVDTIVLIINSSFNHTDESKAKTSEIGHTTIEMIEGELKSIISSKKYKIALFHHHPMLHSNMTYKDGDFLDKSDLLLQKLDSLGFDICIHGHKHDPRLEYKNSITVFGAGSFSSTMNILDLKADNTFHLITLFENTRKGLIESYIYSPKDGWKQKKDTYFPCFTGFGFRTDVNSYANEIATWFLQQGKELVRYSDLIAAFPDLPFLIPADQEILNDKLINQHSLQFNPELINKPEIISKLYS